MTTQVSTSLPDTSSLIKTNHSLPDQGLSARYVWKLGKPLFLSKRQSIVADTYLETRNIAVCLQKLKAELGKAPSYSTVRRMLEIPIVKEYLAEQLEERGVYSGWTKEHWFKVMTDHLRANADYEQAKEDIKIYEGDLEKGKDSAETTINLTNAKARLSKARDKRLANGDLYAMKLIGSFKGWDATTGGVFNQQINITQSDGRA